MSPFGRRRHDSPTWGELVGGLGQALLSLLKVELEAFQHDLGRAGRRVAIALAFFLVTAGIGLWTLGVLTYFLIQLLALWLPVWGAAGVVLLLFFLTMGILGYLGVRQLQKMENPLESARLRVDDHMDWWQTRVAGEAMVVERPPRRPVEEILADAPEMDGYDDGTHAGIEPEPPTYDPADDDLNSDDPREPLR